MTAIRSSHYAETEQRLTNDPIVQDLAAGVSREPREELAHDSGTPRHEFMGAANATYRERGGTDGGHIGAVASAIIALLDEPEVKHWFETGPLTEGGDVVAIGWFHRYAIRPGVTVQNPKGTWTVTAVEERPADAPDGHRVITVRPA